MTTEIKVESYSSPMAGLKDRIDFSLGDWPSISDVNNLGITEKMGQCRHYTIPINNTITTVDNTTNGAQGNLQLLTLQAGLWLVLGAEANVALTKGAGGLASTAAVVASIGSVVPGTDVTLTSTEANIIASTACTLSSGLGTFEGAASASAFLDGSTSAKSLYLNFDVPDAGSTANDTLALLGTVEIFAIYLGTHI